MPNEIPLPDELDYLLEKRAGSSRGGSKGRRLQERRSKGSAPVRAALDEEGIQSTNHGHPPSERRRVSDRRKKRRRAED